MRITRTTLRSLLVLGMLLAGGSLSGAQDPVPPIVPDDPESVVQDPQTPIVVAIQVEGNRRYTSRAMIQALGQVVGKPLDPEAVERGLKVLFRNFHVRGEVRYREAEGGVELRLIVEELALDLEPRFIGNVKVKDQKIREWAGLRDEGELFLFQAKRVKERLLRRYRAEGYYFAEVGVVERPSSVDPETGVVLAPDVIFEIQEGPKVKVTDVVLHGNDTFPNQGLLFFKRGMSKLAQIELRKPRLFGLFAKAFVEETVDSDLISIREVYRDFGYLDAIVELDHLDFSKSRKWVTIHIAIDEGGRYTVGSIQLQAVEQFPDDSGRGGVGERAAELLVPEDELLALLQMKVGDTYERRLQEADERTLRERYGQEGFIDHNTLGPGDRWSFLEPELIFEAERPVVHLRYRIAQGRRIFIREIPIVGNLHTQDRVIRRQISVEPGKVADPEEIRRSRRRITGTGYFSDQRNPGHLEPNFRFKDTDDPNWKDLEFYLEEGQVLTFNLSGGISSNNGAFGRISLSQRNFDLTNLPRSPGSTISDISRREAFHGGGQELTISASPGTEVSQFLLRFREPDLFKSHKDRVSLTLTAVRRLRIFDDYDEERRQTGFEVGRQLSLESGVFAGFTFQTVDVDDLDTSGDPTLGDPLQVPRDLAAQEGRNNLSYINAGYRFRDVDRRFSPHNGFAFVFTNEFYDDTWGADFDFIKSEIRVDWWDELFTESDPDLVSPRYHLGLRAGVAVDYGSSDSVPYTERFFLGGQGTLRGFTFRGVGPNEKGSPIGGQTMLFGTIEYKRPLVKQIQPGTYREVEMLKGGLFFDIGVLDPDSFELDFGEVRMSAGILFGLSVPLPITFSFGWPLRDGKGDDKRVLGFSIDL